VRAAHPAAHLRLRPVERRLPSLRRVGPLLEQDRDPARGLAELPLLLVVVGEPVQELDGVALRGAVLQAADRQAADGLVRVARGELVEQRAGGVDDAGMLAREELERDERGAAARRALVLEPAAEQLELLAVAELPEGPVGDGADAVVGIPGRGLDLVVPLGPQPREVTLRALLGKPGRLGSRCRQIRQLRATAEPARRSAPTA
jgi:hypothetical protein